MKVGIELPPSAHVANTVRGLLYLSFDVKPKAKALEVAAALELLRKLLVLP